jgi:hypothetical protein
MTESPDRNDSRALRRKQVLRRRATAIAILVALPVAIVLAIELPSGSGRTPTAKPPAVTTRPAIPLHRSPPREIRGVHVTLGLAGQNIDRYIALRRHGLNTLEVDVKDERGYVGFDTGTVPLARRVGAARPYYKPWQLARRVHSAGLYLIGRVVTFEDPALAEHRPRLAVRTTSGAIWRNNAGLAWSNPYDRRVWAYNVAIAAAAAKAGFDEIQFDYVRFPSDGDLSIIRYPGPHPQPMDATIPAFAAYAEPRVHAAGARLSVDVFGLSATRDQGIGQRPRQISPYVDAVYPMAYPSHYTPGEFGVSDPNAKPLETVAYTMRDFRRALRGRKAKLIPWLQDFSLGRTYTLAEVRAQIVAARAAHAHGFMLWNAAGVYTVAALAPPGSCKPSMQLCTDQRLR